MNKKTILLIAFVDMSIACMELGILQPCSIKLLPKDIAQNKIAPLLSLQSLGRLRQTSTQCNNVYNVLRVCPIMDENMCLTPACCALAKNYYACTKALAHCARVDEKKMFQHWWAYHAEVRNQNLSLLLKHDNLTMKDRMSAYCKYYSTAKKTKKRILIDVRGGMDREDPSFVKTVLIGNSLNLFDLIKKDYVFPGDSCNEINTLLHNACQLNDCFLVNALCGGNIENKLIQSIVSYSSSRVVGGLIKTGALSINAVDSCKKTLLHYAAEYNLYGVIKILLERDVYVNCTDMLKMTPLHYAVKNRHVQSVIALLESNDADVRFTNKWGRTALDYVKHTRWEPEDVRENRLMIKGLLKSHAEQVSQYTFKDS